jgi:hypothetical protein
MMMVASFSLTLGIMLWQRKGEESPASNLPAAPLVRVTAPVAASAPLPPAPAVIEASKPSGEASAGTPTPGAANEVPVNITWRRRPRFNRVEGRIASSSADSLFIQVRIDGANSHRISQTQVDIAPYGQTQIGVDDGLELQSGDQVTLQSAPYRDQVTQVP